MFDRLKALGRRDPERAAARAQRRADRAARRAHRKHANVDRSAADLEAARHFASLHQDNFGGQ